MPKAVLTFHAITDVCFVLAVHTCVFLALTGPTHCFRGGGLDGNGREQGRGGGGETTDTKKLPGGQETEEQRWARNPPVPVTPSRT